VSIYVTYFALALGVSANAVTVMSIAAGLAGATLLVVPSYLANLWAVALLYLSFLLDQVDGEVARFHACTVTGSYLDEIRHVLIYAVPVFAVSMQMFSARPSLVVAGAGFASALSLIILRFNANAPYLLFTKKVLLGLNGAVVLERAAEVGRLPEPVDGRISYRRSLRWRIGQAVDGLTYVTTNQVSILVLILVHVHVMWFVPNTSLHDLTFLTYAGTVVMLGLFSVWKIACWGRVEKGCVEIERSLHGSRVNADALARATGRSVAHTTRW
jgi:hypothetical protein